MKLKEIFKAFISLLNQKKQPPVEPQVSPQTGEELPQPPNSNKDILKPKLPMIQGLKKNLIVFIGLGIVVIFISSILFGYFSGRGNQNKPTTQNFQPAIDIQDPSKSIPKDYADLSKYNTGNNSPTNRNTPQNSNDNAPNISQKNQPQSNYNTQTPQIPQNYNQNIPNSYLYPTPPISPANAENYNSETNNRHLGSSIRFFSNSNNVSNAQNNISMENDNPQNLSGNDNADNKKKLTSGESQKPNYSKLNQFQLTAGTVIPVTLLTGLNSDIPGQVISQVRQNVYDSLTGKYLLIPQGSRLVGEYANSNIKNGQNRISVNWNRLIFPNGYSVDIDNMPGVDVEGYTGLHDKVNNHTSKILRAAFFTSILAAGAMHAAGNQSSDNQTPGQAAVAGAAANIMTTGQKMMDKNLDMSPTIIVRPGTAFAVFVNRDLVLKPY